MALDTSKALGTVDTEDRQLIAECLDGQPESFGLLVGKYQDRLYNTVVHLIGSREDAQDVVQDAFVRAFRKLESFQGDSAFYTWLYRIAVNTALSLKRSAKPRVSLDQVRQASGREPAADQERTNPTADLERTERRKQVWEALGELSAEHRTVLVLRDIEGHRYDEIAEILGCPVGTVRSRLFRARMELRGRLTSIWSDQGSARDASGRR